MKKPRRATLSPADAALFRASVSDVTPLRQVAKVEHDLPSSRAIATSRKRDAPPALADKLSDAMDAVIEAGDELSFVRNGIGPRTLKNLRRGHWTVQDELDLHGLTSTEARARLVEFLNRCVHRGARCVRIIHGKGLRSPNREPVLKQKVGYWLMQREEVLAFRQARPSDGGGGAVMVLLKGR
ncbi:MAG TPA: Smr/MutS family protein [Burkholderiales bacterium]|nr:Smr/MutS family protein [Burkholderiales bacterium]